MSKLKSPLVFFFVTLLVIVLIALLGPEEKGLGANVRIVYLHGAWVLTAELAFAASALAGLLGLVARKEVWLSGICRDSVHGFHGLHGISRKTPKKSVLFPCPSV